MRFAHMSRRVDRARAYSQNALTARIQRPTADCLRGVESQVPTVEGGNWQEVDMESMFNRSVKKN